MKKTIDGFRILDTTEIEINESVETTIERLLALQGTCRDEDSSQHPLEFICSKKGKFSVNSRCQSLNSDSNIYSYKTYFIKGKVVNQNNKTKILIHTVKDNTVKFFKGFYAIANFFLLLVFIISQIYRKELFSWASVISTISLAIAIFLCFHQNENDEYYKHSDIEIMKSEVIRRVEAVKRWND